MSCPCNNKYEPGLCFHMILQACGNNMPRWQIRHMIYGFPYCCFFDSTGRAIVSGWSFINLDVHAALKIWLGHFVCSIVFLRVPKDAYMSRTKFPMPYYHRCNDYVCDALHCYTVVAFSRINIFKIWSWLKHALCFTQCIRVIKN